MDWGLHLGAGANHEPYNRLPPIIYCICVLPSAAGHTGNDTDDLRLLLHNKVIFVIVFNKRPRYLAIHGCDKRLPAVTTRFFE